MTRFFKSVYTATLCSLMFTSCSEDLTALVQDTLNKPDPEEITLSTDMDISIEAMGKLSSDIFDKEETKKRQSTPTETPKTCTTISSEIENNMKNVTIDFGTEGCEIEGHTYKGKMIQKYAVNFSSLEVVVNHTFDDFYIDDIKVEGTIKTTRELQSENNKPQRKDVIELTFIWPNEAEGTRKGNRTIIWTEGFGNTDNTDDVFEITGNWTSNFIDGKTHSHTVKKALVAKSNCNYIVSGIIDSKFSKFGGEINYGDGECDSKGMLTLSNGTEIPIVVD